VKRDSSTIKLLTNDFETSWYRFFLVENGKVDIVPSTVECLPMVHLLVLLLARRTRGGGSGPLGTGSLDGCYNFT
jgi:hypothetical protein